MRLITTLVFAILLMVGCKSQAGTSSANSESPFAEGRVYKAPDFQLTDLKGQKISLNSYKGKVVFLDFWATWCPPCVMSSPEVEKLVVDYKDKGLVVISVSLDDSAEPVKRFLENHKLNAHVTMAGDSGIDGKYGIQGIPAFYIIDQNGNIANAWQGYAPAMTSLWRKEIDRLLKV